MMVDYASQRIYANSKTDKNQILSLHLQACGVLRPRSPTGALQLDPTGTSVPNPSPCAIRHHESYEFLETPLIVL